MIKFSDEKLKKVDEIVARYPSIAKHLEKGVAVRPWVGTGRLQFSATDSVGKTP